MHLFRFDVDFLGFRGYTINVPIFKLERLFLMAHPLPVLLPQGIQKANRMATIGLVKATNRRLTRRLVDSALNRWLAETNTKRLAEGLAPYQFRDSGVQNQHTGHFRTVEVGVTSDLDLDDSELQSPFRVWVFRLEYVSHPEAPQAFALAEPGPVDLGTPETPLVVKISEDLWNQIFATRQPVKVTLPVL